MRPDAPRRIERAMDVLVVGGGPAGMACASACARQGLSVTLVDQRASLGGAIFRQPVGGAAPVPQSASSRQRWRRLLADLTAAPGLDLRLETLFLGLEADGLALIEDRNAGRVLSLRPRALVLATGAVERVLPRPGWTLPGVVTAGGLQVMMKETGRPPAGRVVLAGSGPLLLAVAAQMTGLGHPPLAILEAGDPLRRWSAGLALLSHPALLREAAGYLATLARARVPWHRGAVLRRIAAEGEGETLVATWTDRRGASHSLAADRIALHDGLAENAFGLPEDAEAARRRPLVLRIGDCRAALGAPAAIADGTAAGERIAARLASPTGRQAADAETEPAALARHRAAQGHIARAFAPLAPVSPADLADDTVLCRCESRTVGDLKRLLAEDEGLSPRELKLSGRFAMGACQGRFCAANTAAVTAALTSSLTSSLTGTAIPFAPGAFTGQRWPIRPVPIAALAAPAPAPSLPDESQT